MLTHCQPHLPTKVDVAVQGVNLGRALFLLVVFAELLVVFDELLANLHDVLSKECQPTPSEGRCGALCEWPFANRQA